MGLLCYLVTALWILHGLRVRKRLRAIAVLSPSTEPVSPGHCFLAVPGVTLDEATRRAASAYATAEGLEVLDLVPADIPALQVLGLVKLVDPEFYRHNPIGDRQTAGYALLVSRDLLRRAGLEESLSVKEADLVRALKALKRYAYGNMDLAVALGLHACPKDRSERGEVLRAALGSAFYAVFIGQFLTWILLACGLIFSPIAGGAALAVYHLQPWISFAGLRQRPRDLWSTVLLRSPIELWLWLRMIPVVFRAVPGHELTEARRPFYADMLAKGLDSFFEPRRETCPLCNSRNLAVRVRCSDLMQGKPGRFTLERCRDCGHVFQNPRLSIKGLNYYYGDFYEGLGEELTESVFGIARNRYIARARVLAAIAAPSRWLDVGTGHAHFCCVARSVWPEARFDGLDVSHTVKEAQDRGWIQQGFLGLFPDLAPTFAGHYDVVSMFYYLEHTVDPRLELSAARQALGPGGVLVIEVPDPECPVGYWLGRFWLPWFQPQHLHLISMRSLQRMLVEEGFQPVITNRPEAHIPVDCLMASYLLCSWCAGKLGTPWREQDSWLDRTRYYLVWAFSPPLLAFGWMLDRLLAPVLRRAGYSNTYWVVARRS